ncbi:heparinase II/III domain-containing protein [Janibacter anophelis]|uniref:heparinase II/III domain-containing protein n=1 Tax=Janibacter anophelis TaxID=319054 RepID=UPI000836A75D|nr:heparinase II/III family protein [Janibacter anophelis]
MPSISSVVKDVRALGASAPLRAVYEASKRTNGHARLFRPVPGGYTSTPLDIGHHVPSSERARGRCLEDARLIVEEGTRVFGERVPTGSSASWAMDPLTGRCWPEDTPWWQIDIRTDQRLSDVKFTWESARHRDLVVLARASVLEPDGPWFPHLESMLVRWCRECRPEEGVNWYSSLELALRAIAWSQVLRLVGDRLHGGLRAELDDQLVASARHIMVELPYTMTSMKNNHLLGDGLGLMVLGKMFPDHPAAGRWRSMGDRLMLKQLGRHMLPDGSMIEDSLSYHRFVLEMFIVRVLIGDAPDAVARAMSTAAEHLITLGVLDGDVPQYGDWDEGRVLADSAPAGDVAGAALLARHLVGGSTPASAWDIYDELAWYAAASGTAEPAPPRPEGPWTSGHFSGVRRGLWAVWLKRSLTPSHQHADLTSVWIQHDGSWVTRDPGTGTYNGPLHVRDGFRTSAAHPVWRPDGGDLLGPHRAFRWQRSTVPAGSAAVELPLGTILAVWHDGFDEGRCLRLVLVEDSGVTVIDRLPEGARGWVMTAPEGDAGERLVLEGSTSTIAEEAPFAGWISETYGRWAPSPWRQSRADAGWFVWGAGDTRTINDEHLTVREDDDLVTIDLEIDGTLHTVEVARA